MHSQKKRSVLGVKRSMNIFRFCDLKVRPTVKDQNTFLHKKVCDLRSQKYIYSICLFYGFCKFTILRESRNLIKKWEILKPYLIL